MLCVVGVCLCRCCHVFCIRLLHRNDKWLRVGLAKRHKDNWIMRLEAY